MHLLQGVPLQSLDLRACNFTARDLRVLHSSLSTSVLQNLECLHLSYCLCWGHRAEDTHIPFPLAAIQQDSPGTYAAASAELALVRSLEVDHLVNRDLVAMALLRQILLSGVTEVSSLSIAVTETWPLLALMNKGS